MCSLTANSVCESLSSSPTPLSSSSSCERVERRPGEPGLPGDPGGLEPGDPLALALGDPSGEPFVLEPMAVGVEWWKDGVAGEIGWRRERNRAWNRYTQQR